MMFSHLTQFCWVVFGLVWILGSVFNLLHAPKTKKRRFRYDWLVLSLLALVGMHFAPHQSFTILQHHFAWLQIIGVILLVGSTIYTVWSRLVLGRMWATHAAVKEEHHLVTNGPYKITRHPIYSGILGMILGSVFALNELMVFLGFLIALAFFLIRIRNEEKLMVMTFGETYIQYQKRVPQLIPGLRWRKKQ